jgi:hypothetical protein
MDLLFMSIWVTESWHNKVTKEPHVLGLINIKTTGIDTMFQSECVYRFP